MTIVYNAQQRLTGTAFTEGAVWTDEVLTSHDFNDGVGILTFSDSLITLLDEFAGTDITGLEIGSGVTNLGEGCLSGCTSLESLSLPSTLTHLYTYALDGCQSLKQVVSLADECPICDEPFGFTNTVGVIVCPKGSERSYQNELANYLGSGWVTQQYDRTKPNRKPASSVYAATLSVGSPITDVTVRTFSKPLFPVLLFEDNLGGKLTGQAYSASDALIVRLRLDTSYEADELAETLARVEWDSQDATGKVLHATAVISIQVAASVSPMAGIEFDVSAVTYSSEAFDKRVHFTAEGVEELTVSSTDAWLNVSLDGDGVVLKASRNSGEERSAAVSLKGYNSQGKELGTNLTVTQEAATAEAEGYISFSPIEVVTRTGYTTSSSSAQPTIFVYPSGVSDFTITNAYTSWVEHDWYDDGEDRELNLYIKPNFNPEERHASIYINAVDAKGKKVFSTVEVTQSGMTEETAYVTSDSSEMTVSFAAGEYSASLYGRGYDASVCRRNADVNWIYDISYSAGTLTFSVQPNTGDELRTGYVWYEFRETGGSSFTVQNYIKVTQMPTSQFVQFPIWQDTEVQLQPNADGYVDYKVVQDGLDRYIGRCYESPDGECSVLLNEILRDLVREDINLQEEGMQNSSAFLSAELHTSGDGGYTWQHLLDIKTWNDWSYEEAYSNFISKPISDVLDRRQYLVYSYLDLYASSPFTVEISYSTQGRRRKLNFVVDSSIQTFVTDVVTKKDINVGDRVFRVEETCKPFCLYYTNRKGGWDSVLMNRTSKQVDSVTNHDYERKYLTGTASRGTVQFQKDIRRKWQLKTDLLDDRQAALMADALESPQVYLQDFATGEVIPVVVTDATVEHRTFFNNSRKKVQYTVNVEDSQKRMRR